MQSIQQEMKEKSLSERIAFDKIFQKERLTVGDYPAAKIAWNAIKCGGYKKCQIKTEEDQEVEVLDQAPEKVEEEKEIVKEIENVPKFKPTKRKGKKITRTSSKNVSTDS